MKVLLVKPPESHFDKEGPVKTCDHIGLGYICAVLRQNGYEVRILDAAIEKLDLETLGKRILGTEFDALGISVPYQLSVPEALELVGMLRKGGLKKKIWIGGHPSTFMYETILRQKCEIDYVCIGEGEYTVLEMMNAVRDNQPLEGIKGLAYRKDGEVVFTGYRDLIETLDDLPIPERDYLAGMIEMVEFLPVAISSSRGCSWACCSFCDIQSFYRPCPGMKWRARSIPRVVDELETIVKKYNRNKFNFVDDDFFGPKNTSKERIDNFCSEIKRRGLRIEFFFACNVRDIEEETLLKLKEVGLTSLFLGIESGVQRVLDTFRKGPTVEENRQAILLTKKLGIECQCGSIFIDPYSTIDEIKSNVAFWESVGEMSFGAYKVLIPYYGTPLQKRLMKENRLAEKDFQFSYEQTLEPDVKRFTAMVDRAKENYIRKYRARLTGIRGIIIKTMKANSLRPDELKDIMQKVGKLYAKLSYETFTYFVKRALDEIGDVNEMNMDSRLREIFSGYLKEYEQVIAEVENRFRHILENEKIPSRKGIFTDVVDVWGNVRKEAAGAVLS